MKSGDPTIRRCLLLMVACLSFLTWASPGAGQDFTLAFEDSSRAVVLDGTVTAWISIVNRTGGATTLDSIFFNIRWDPTRLSENGAERGPTWSGNLGTRSAGDDGFLSANMWRTGDSRDSARILAPEWKGVGEGSTSARIELVRAVSSDGETVTSRVETGRPLSLCVGQKGVYGDVDGDGDVDVVDAQRIARHAAGLPVEDQDRLELAGDVSGNGTVDVLDAQQVARHATGLDVPGRAAEPIPGGCDDARTGEPPTVRIVSPEGGTTVGRGTELQFEATAADPEEGALEGEAIRWSSHRDGELGTGAELRTSTLSEGIHEVTVTATDSSGLSAQVQTFVAVDDRVSRIPLPGAPNDVAVTPDGRQVLLPLLEESLSSDPDHPVAVYEPASGSVRRLGARLRRVNAVEVRDGGGEAWIGASRARIISQGDTTDVGVELVRVDLTREDAVASISDNVSRFAERPGEGEIWVTDGSGDAFRLTVYDVETLTAQWSDTILGRSGVVGRAAVFDPTGRRFFFTSAEPTRGIWRIFAWDTREDVLTERRIDRCCTQVRGLAAGASGETVWRSVVEERDARSLDVLRSESVSSNAPGIVLGPQGERIYVLDGGGVFLRSEQALASVSQLVVLRRSDLMEVARIPVGSTGGLGLAVSSSGDQAYVADSGTGALMQVDLSGLP